MKDKRENEPGSGFFVVFVLPGEVGIAVYTGTPGNAKSVHEAIMPPKDAQLLAATIMQAADKARKQR